tara:strand:- start:11070 stop:14729 length:3660 start_codon:yes stop_codon:yes gene_type:complete
MSYLFGEKLSTTFKQVVAIGGDDDRAGIHATTQKAIWTDDGTGGINAFPLTAAQDALQITSTNRLEFNNETAYIYGSSAGVLATSAATSTVIGTALFDLNASAGITIDGTTIAIAGTGASSFTATGGNLTLSTATSGEMFLTPVNYIQVASNKKLQFGGANDYLSGTGSALTVGSGGDINLTPAGSSDVNIPAGKGLVFDSNDSEKIESDDTDLTISSGGYINLTATAGVKIPSGIALQFHDANEKITGNGSAITINSGEDINLTCATGDVNIPANIGLTFGDDGEKIEGDGSNLFIYTSGDLALRSSGNSANAIYLHADAGTSETIKIHSDQGTSVTEGAASVSLISDAGGVELRSTADLANAINLTVDGGTTSSMTLFNDTGNSVTEGSASIQLLSDVGGIGIKSTSGLANAILLTTDGGTDETIKLHSDQGTGADSIELTSDAGGIDVNAAAGTVAVDALVLSLDSTTNSNLTMTADTGSTQTLTVSATNSNGSNVGDLLLNADGQVHIRSDITTNTYADAGIQIGTDASGVDVAIGHTTSDVRIGDNLLVTGDATVSGNLTVTNALSYGSAAITTQDITHTAPYLTFTNTTHQDTDMDDSSDNSAGRESKLLFKGEKNDGTVHELATIQVGHQGTGDDYKGQIQFFVNDGNDSAGALTNAMNILDTGNIGIGTTTPTQSLHVEGAGSIKSLLKSTTSSAGVQIQSHDEDNNSSVEFLSGGASAGQIYYDHHATPADQKMIFQVGDGSVTAMTVDGSGNVGIGTTAPSSPLSVESNVADEGVLAHFFDGTMADTDFFTINIGKAATTHNCGVMKFKYTATGHTGNYISLGLKSTEDTLCVTSDRNVGIGTASPAEELHIVNSAGTSVSPTIKLSGAAGATSNQEMGRILFHKHGSSVTSYIKAFNTATHGSNLGFGVVASDAAASADAMTIIQNGNVGIGTATPDAKFDVSMRDAAANGIDQLAFFNSDNVGAASEANIYVGYELSANNAAVFGYRHIGNGSTSNYSYWMNYGEDADQGIVLADGGNVGIGTATPGTMLTIGDVSADQDTFIRIQCDTDNSAGIQFYEETTQMWAFQLDGDDSNKFELYDHSDTSTSMHVVAGGTAWVADSDERIKKDIKNIDSVLDDINNLRPITYKRKYGNLDTTHAGLIAQEVKPHFPLVVEGNENDFELLTPAEDKPKQYKGAMSIGYSDFVPYLIKAVQELSAKVTALENA